MTESVLAVPWRIPAGAPTFNGNREYGMKMEGFFLQCNICYPASVEYNDIWELLERQLKKYGFFYNEVDYLVWCTIKRTQH